MESWLMSKAQCTTSIRYRQMGARGVDGADGGAGPPRGAAEQGGLV